MLLHINIFQQFSVVCYNFYKNKKILNLYSFINASENHISNQQKTISIVTSLSNLKLP